MQRRARSEKRQSLNDLCAAHLADLRTPYPPATQHPPTAPLRWGPCSGSEWRSGCPAPTARPTAAQTRPPPFPPCLSLPLCRPKVPAAPPRRRDPRREAHRWPPAPITKGHGVARAPMKCFFYIHWYRPQISSQKHRLKQQFPCPAKLFRARINVSSILLSSEYCTVFCRTRFFELC